MNIGHTVKQPLGYRAFIPSAFPPADLSWSAETSARLETANLMLGRLDGITELLPDVDFFIFMYVKKESALSSQVEGTQATIADAIRAESEIRYGLPNDVDDILRYVSAMNLGLLQLNEIPLSLRLLRNVHRELLAGGRSHGHVSPGEFRTSQNWIGGSSPNNARYVPPPPHEMQIALSELEKFLHQEDSLPKLIKAALAHAQFETIHPFLDGNGRTGRLLITFFLCEQRILSKPVLYLSEFFREHREFYFDLLNGYHGRNEVEPWLSFFLDGVAEVSERAIATARAVAKIQLRDTEKIASFGRTSKVALVLLRHLFKVPIVSVRNVEGVTGLSRANANKLVAKFVDAKLLTVTDETLDYGRQFAYLEYLQLFTSE